MREEYILMRRKNELNIQFFYKFYLENRKPIHQVLSIQIFMQVFQFYIQQYHSNVLDYLDGFFNVTKIENENNQIIYIN